MKLNSLQALLASFRYCTQPYKKVSAVKYAAHGNKLDRLDRVPYLLLIGFLTSFIVCWAPIAFAADRAALSQQDTHLVLEWIAKKVAENKQDYCYRRSDGRGVGKPVSVCPEGRDKSGLLCYEKCEAGWDGVGPVCWEKCPEGYTDNGLTCGRGASSMHIEVEHAHCPPGFSNTGTSCYRAWTPKSESLDRASCRNGMERKGAFCYSKCPSGYTNTGVSCYRGPSTEAHHSKTRDLGKPMVCNEGMQEQAGLCYSGCKSGFHGEGPVCWQNCPAGRNDCGIGCSTSKNACASDTASMVISPVMLAANIFTGGASGEAEEAFTNVQKAMKVAKEAAAAIKDSAAVKLATSAYNVGNAAYQFARTVDLWAAEFVRTFLKMTTPEVDSELKKHFKGDALYWVQRQYALAQMQLMMSSDATESTQHALSAISGFDPSGVTSVISAFAKPMCNLNEPFPEVRPLY